jgi:arabinose-5-phosphate isomerase
MTAIVNDNWELVGLVTDGDLRRILDEKIDIHQDLISSVMTSSPMVAQRNMLAAQALNIMEEKKINGLIIVDEQQHPIGAMNMHDLLRSGVL